MDFVWAVFITGCVTLDMLISLALHFFNSYMKEVQTDLMIPNPASKFWWVSTESNQVRGVWRNLSSPGNERSQPSKGEKQESWGSTPHTLSPAPRAPTSITHLASSILPVFLNLVHRTLHSLASVCLFAQNNYFISIDLQCGPRKWQLFSFRKEENQAEHSWGRLQNCF